MPAGNRLSIAGAEGWREDLSAGAVSVGVSVGVLAGLIAYFWIGNPVLGAVLGVAMITNMFAAGIMGTVVPMILKRLNVDPAIASGIFLHTFTDVVGFLSFLGLAAVLLL